MRFVPEYVGLCPASAGPKTSRPLPRTASAGRWSRCLWKWCRWSGIFILHETGPPHPYWAARRPSQMAPIANPPEAGQSPWWQVLKFLLLAVLISLIFLLGQQMVRHRFFRGGWVDQRDVLKP